MNKDELINKMNENGESIITYRSVESKKLKYNACTLDFNNAYIQEKHNRAKETDDTLLMWCWDIDSFRLMRVDTVTRVDALADAIAGVQSGR